jgi:hypothetical protein
MRPELWLLVTALAGLLVGGAASCLGTSTFRCDDDGACDLRADGRCEGSGHCSYPDDTCPLGRRYADAGELGEECVGAATAGADTSTTGTDTSTTGIDTSTTDDTAGSTGMTGDTDTTTGSTTGSGVGESVAVDSRSGLALRDGR